MASAARSTDLVVTSNPARSFHLLTAMSERRPAWPTKACIRRTPGENSVFSMSKFDIGRELAVVAVRTQVVGTRHFHLCQRP